MTDLSTPDEQPTLFDCGPRPDWGHPGIDEHDLAELWTPGTILRTARAYAGLSQRELAERTELSPSTISRVEGSRVHPRWPVLVRTLLACHLRLALVTNDGEVITHAPLVGERDAARRHYPAHLAIRRVEKPGDHWVNSGRYAGMVCLRLLQPYTYQQRPRHRGDSD